MVLGGAAAVLFPDLLQCASRALLMKENVPQNTATSPNIFSNSVECSWPRESGENHQGHLQNLEYYMGSKSEERRKKQTKKKKTALPGLLQTPVVPFRVCFRLQSKALGYKDQVTWQKAVVRAASPRAVACVFEWLMCTTPVLCFRRALEVQRE
ncbi:hypothetical protein EK904_013632 [Melospiza melodia maxima]|nr:hypothetical protein EK904_013632 [Melospiza melodia maxima]